MANRFWVGGTGTWDATSTTHWSTATGGATGASNPTSADDVIFDANSGGGTVSIDTASVPVCQSLDMTNAVTMTMSWQNSASSALKIGSASGGKLVIGTNVTLGSFGSTVANALQLVATSTNSGAGWPITTNGKTLPPMTFGGAGGRWQLQDNLTVTTQGSGILALGAGTLDTNSKTIAGWEFDASTSTAKTLLLTSSTWNLSATSTAWHVTGANTTITSSGETINCTGAGGFTDSVSTATYKTVSLQGGGGLSLSTNTSFFSFSRTGPASKTSDNWVINTSFTVTSTLTLTGNSAVNRMFMNGGTLGTAKVVTVTGATLSISNVDIQDMTFSGTPTSATWASVGDCGGNTGITFDTPQNNYWIGHTGSWGTAANWSISSGGAANGRVPLPQDTAVFDGSSFSAGSQTVTGDMPRVGAVDWTLATNSPTWTPSQATTIQGSLTLIAAMTQGGTQTLTFNGRSNFTVTTANKTFTGSLTFQGFGATATISGALHLAASKTLTLTAGTLDVSTNNPAVTADLFVCTGTITRGIHWGTGGWSISNATSGTVWSLTTSGYTSTGTADIITVAGATSASRTFAGGGATYGRLVDNASGQTGALVITGANTFAGITFSDASTARSLTLPAASTTTLTDTFIANGTSGQLMTVQSSSGGSAATMNFTGSGSIVCSYLSLKDSTVQVNGATAAGTGVWEADDSVVVSNVTGWTLGPTFNALAQRSAPGLRWVTGNPHFDMSMMPGTFAVAPVAYTVSDTETLTTADAVARVLAAARADAETNNTADAVARVATLARAITEALVTADAVVRAEVLARVDSETLTTADALAVTQALIRGDAETLATADALTRAAAAGRTDVEALTTLDAIANAQTLARSIAETLTTSDSVLVSVGHLRADAETLDTVDAIARQAAMARTLSETVSATDSTLRVLAIVRTNVENVPVSDSLAVLSNHNVALTESLSTIDTLVASRLISRASTETLATTDVLSVVAGHVRPISESLTTLDSLARAWTGARDDIELLSTRDAVAMMLGAPRSITETLATTDALVRRWMGTRTAVESLGLADTLEIVLIFRLLQIALSVSPVTGLALAVADVTDVSLTTSAVTGATLATSAVTDVALTASAVTNLGITSSPAP